MSLLCCVVATVCVDWCRLCSLPPRDRYGILALTDVHVRDCGRTGGSSATLGVLELSQLFETSITRLYGANTLGTLLTINDVSSVVLANTTVVVGAGESGAVVVTQASVVQVNRALVQHVVAGSGNGAGLSLTTVTTATVTASVFQHNTALAGSGGAMSVLDVGTLTVDGCLFANNSALGDGAGGGAIAVGASAVSIGHTTFTGNRAYDGGGIHTVTALAMQVRDCTFTSNTATNKGGAVSSSLSADASTALDVEFTRVTIQLCAALNGGGIAVTSESRTFPLLALADSAISSCTAGVGGGALLVEQAVVLASNIAIHNNTALVGAGVRASTSAVELTDSSLSFNNAVTHVTGLPRLDAEWIGHGGGFHVIGCDVELLATAVVHNSAYRSGGAVKSYSSNVLVDRCIVAHNVALLGSGGAVRAHLLSSVHLNSVVAAYNVANQQAGGSVVPLVDEAPEATLVGGGVVSCEGCDSLMVTASHPPGFSSGDTYASIVGTPYMPNVDAGPATSWLGFNAAPSGYGGALMADGSTGVVVADAVFTSNTALVGGAIVVAETRDTAIRTASFEANAATVGGAIAWDLASQGTTMSDLRVVDTVGGGGAVYSGDARQHTCGGVCVFANNSGADVGTAPSAVEWLGLPPTVTSSATVVGGLGMARLVDAYGATSVYPPTTCETTLRSVASGSIVQLFYSGVFAAREGIVDIDPFAAVAPSGKYVCAPCMLL